MKGSEWVVVGWVVDGPGQVATAKVVVVVVAVVREVAGSVLVGWPWLRSVVVRVVNDGDNGDRYGWQ